MSVGFLALPLLILSRQPHKTYKNSIRYQHMREPILIVFLLISAGCVGLSPSSPEMTATPTADPNWSNQSAISHGIVRLLEEDANCSSPKVLSELPPDDQGIYRYVIEGETYELTGFNHSSTAPVYSVTRFEKCIMYNGSVYLIEVENHEHLLNPRNLSQIISPHPTNASGS